jgi:hypothetical protein
MTEGAMVCANHPNRETTLRCNRCGKPICTRCAVHTPVGYRCRECVRGQQTVFETARPIDYPIAAVVSAIGVGLGTSVLMILSFWGLIVAPVAGGALAEIVRWAVRRRRGRRLALAAVVGGLVGMLPQLAFPAFLLIGALSNPRAAAGIGGAALGALWPVLISGLMISTLYARIRGIQL